MPVLSQALDIGEEETFKINLKEAGFLKRKDIINIGISDTTGKIHWPSQKEFKRIRKEYKNALGEDNNELS